MKPIPFRIHTSAGAFDIEARTPQEATRIFTARHPGIIIKKIKVVKDGK